MKATQRLHGLGQSLWLDNVPRELLASGALQRYIDEWSVTGLTSNLRIFEEAIRNSNAYDVTIRERLSKGKSAEMLFFELALEDVTRAADFFQPIHQRTNGVDGWVSLDVSPLLVHDATKTVEAAKDLFARAKRSNLFIKIPGTREGLAAIEEAIFAGIPVNVTLLFSRQQYVAAADAFLKGVERRIDAGLNPDVPSVASIFVSRWDVAANDKVSGYLRNKLGIAAATRSYRAYRSLLASPRWQRAYNFGARPQRLLWCSTGTKDSIAAGTLYVTSLAGPSQSREPKAKTDSVVKQAVAIASLFLIAGGILTLTAQQPTQRDNSLATLKEQLIDAQAKETWLRMHLEELDEQLKPESIERALAGIGSTRPEELREHRRKLLTIERNGLQARLDLLEEDRARLLAAIADAETEAYLKSAQPLPIPPEPV